MTAPDYPMTGRVRPAAAPVAEVSEDAIALSFTAKYRDIMKFDHTAGRWFRWDGERWQKDGTDCAFHHARVIGRNLGEGKRQICKASVAGGAERMARADPAHAVEAGQWDADPMLLGTPGGTVDLRTGKLRKPDPADKITRLTSCTPSTARPAKWLQFLQETTGGDAELMRFLQQWLGYCLTGETREHALLFIYGPGGNGKSVFLNTATRILADYAATAGMDTFTASKFDHHPTDLAMLQGARLVSASETEEGRAWAEARIKQMTGGDPITARFMRRDFFTYTPAFKLMIVGNHAPVLHNVDEAARRRFNIVPFTRKPATPDRQLEQKLKAEDGAILAWMIAGCLDWQADGLVRPDSVTAATDDYFNDQDLFGQWISERCKVGHYGLYSTPMNLFNDWSNYARSLGDEPGNAQTMSNRLRRNGFRSAKTNGYRVYRGITLRFAS
jgi:putative DNA primase/helicase